MKEDIKSALEIIKKGGTILYPTDTIWGIGCDATDVDAVQKIYKIKKRTDTKSMLVLVDTRDRIKRYVKVIPQIVTQILKSENKPLTIIYPEAKNLAANLIAGDGTIGIRIVKDEFCKKLIARLDKPIVSTSANITGETAPRNFREIDDEILRKVDYIVKWRQDDDSQNSPSAIIKIGINSEVEIIRK
jgi:L-threonylcarbamoyladenylate synthase